MGRTAHADAVWRIWPVPAGDWVEIDDDADLDLAHAMVAP